MTDRAKGRDDKVSEANSPMVALANQVLIYVKNYILPSIIFLMFRRVWWPLVSCTFAGSIPVSCASTGGF